MDFLENRASEFLQVTIDEASTTRIKGWAINRDGVTPAFLRFLLDGTPLWDGVCTELREDVRAAGYGVAHVGFELKLVLASDAAPVLRVEDYHKNLVPVSMKGVLNEEVSLGPSIQPWGSDGVQSHIDGFSRGWVQGWVLRAVPTPEGSRLLGRCTVALVLGKRVVAETVGKQSRSDVAEALDGEEQCGFALEVPRSMNEGAVIRLMLMPERVELQGSPCIIPGSGS